MGRRQRHLTACGAIPARRHSPLAAAVVLNVLAFAPHAHRQEACYKRQLLPNDPDDNKFVDVASAASADFSFTNDRHFDVFRQLKFPRAPVVSLQEFLRSFR